MRRTEIVSLRDLSSVVEHAKACLVSLPKGVRLVGMSRALTDAERLAVSYLQGALMAAGARGIDTSSLVIAYEVPDSETVE